MKFCFDPSDGDMVLLDGEGDSVDWHTACVTMESIYHVIMEHATSLCLDNEDDRVRLIAMLAREAEFCDDVTEDLDSDPYDDYDDDLNLLDPSEEDSVDKEWEIDE